MHIVVQETALDPWQSIVDYQNSRAFGGKVGATAAFVGTMRDINEAQTVRSMFIEHYPGMTEKYLQELAQQAMQRWSIEDVLICHRVGELYPDDPIVVVAVWAAHRAHAFEACRHLMEALKSTAPFWKREQLNEGARWVESNTPGHTNP
jgi:molybdopterin synthase catalytic subunit